jgi:hypothetical protein
MVKKPKNIILTFAIGIVVFVGITLSCILALSFFLLNEQIGQGGADILTWIIIAIASGVAADILMRNIKGNRLIIATGAGCMHMLLLTIGGCIAGGEFKSVYGHLLAICCGCTLSCTIHRNRGTRTKKIKMNNR